jgi:hypothetical protein
MDMQCELSAPEQGFVDRNYTNAMIICLVLALEIEFDDVSEIDYTLVVTNSALQWHS